MILLLRGISLLLLLLMLLTELRIRMRLVIKVAPFGLLFGAQLALSLEGLLPTIRITAVGRSMRHVLHVVAIVLVVDFVGLIKFASPLAPRRFRAGSRQAPLATDVADVL